MQYQNIIDVTKSVSGKIIRLTFKQLAHIVESHDYMAGNIEKILETVNSPDYVVKGTKDELIAVRHYIKTNLGEKYSVVIYKENQEDGFVITAFFTSRPETIRKESIIWKKLIL